MTEIPTLIFELHICKVRMNNARACFGKYVYYHQSVEERSEYVTKDVIDMRHEAYHVFFFYIFIFFFLTGGNIRYLPKNAQALFIASNPAPSSGSRIILQSWNFQGGESGGGIPREGQYVKGGGAFLGGQYVKLLQFSEQYNPGTFIQGVFKIMGHIFLRQQNIGNFVERAVVVGGSSMLNSCNTRFIFFITFLLPLTI